MLRRGSVTSATISAGHKYCDNRCPAASLKISRFAAFSVAGSMRIEEAGKIREKAVMKISCYRSSRAAFEQVHDEG
jgi:hypothetical protein